MNGQSFSQVGQNMDLKSSAGHQGFEEREFHRPKI
jgi:hypothetical protein